MNILKKNRLPKLPNYFEAKEMKFNCMLTTYVADELKKRILIAILQSEEEMSVSEFIRRILEEYFRAQESKK